MTYTYTKPFPFIKTFYILRPEFKFVIVTLEFSIFRESKQKFVATLTKILPMFKCNSVCNYI